MSAGAHSNDDNALAGEYVLGVLPADMRREVEQRLAVDPDFAALVGSWQSDLSSLDQAYTPETPPRGVKARIEAQLFAGVPGATQPAGGLWASLAFWRGLTTAAIATSLGLAAFTFVVNERPADPAGAPALVAELGAPGSSVGLIAALDPASGALQVTPAAFSRKTQGRLNFGWFQVRALRCRSASCPATGGNWCSTRVSATVFQPAPCSR